MMANPVVPSSSMAAVPSASTVAALAACSPHPHPHPRASSLRHAAAAAAAATPNHLLPPCPSNDASPSATAPAPNPTHDPRPSWRASIRLVLVACTRGHGLLPFTLAAMGYATGALIVHLHMQHRVTHYLAVRGLGMDWLPVVAAGSALLVGLLYLVADARAGDEALSVQGLRVGARRQSRMRRRVRREPIVEPPRSEPAHAKTAAGDSDDDEHMDFAADALLRYSTTRSRGGSLSSEYAASAAASGGGLRARSAAQQRVPGDTTAAESEYSDTDEASDAFEDGGGGDEQQADTHQLFASSANPADAWRRALKFRSKRTLILRCVGALTGINYAVSKIPQIPILLSGTLLALVLAVYYMVDRTLRGLVISLGVASVGTWVCHSLTSRGYLAFVRPDMAGSIQSWVPVLLLASAVCVGNAARVLVRMAAVAEGREVGARGGGRAQLVGADEVEGEEGEQELEQEQELEGPDSVMDQDLDAIPQVFEMGNLDRDAVFFDSGIVS